MTPPAVRISLRPLGRSYIRITRVGLGCWQFSQGKGLNKYRPVLPKAEIEGITAASIDSGINWFDTAEGYGNGASERELARVNGGSLEDRNSFSWFCGKLAVVAIRGHWTLKPISRLFKKKSSHLNSA